MNKWQPIDTAPDCGQFLVALGDEIFIARNDGDGDFECVHTGDYLGGYCRPTLWMPILGLPQGDDHAGS